MDKPADEDVQKIMERQAAEFDRIGWPQGSKLIGLIAAFGGAPTVEERVRVRMPDDTIRPEPGPRIISAILAEICESVGLAFQRLHLLESAVIQAELPERVGNLESLVDNVIAAKFVELKEKIDAVDAAHGAILDDILDRLEALDRGSRYR